MDLPGCCPQAQNLGQDGAGQLGWQWGQCLQWGLRSPQELSLTPLA